MTVYLGEYGRWWSLTLNDWISICEREIALAIAYEQPEKSWQARKELARKPNDIKLYYEDDEETGEEFPIHHSFNPHQHVVEPGNWKIEDYVEELNEMYEIIKRKRPLSEIYKKRF